jgi:photosystem II stability/assembly factor-like uncharacterized protein
MTKRSLLLLQVSIVLLMSLALAIPASANWWGKFIKRQLQVGWVIGWDETDTAVILHTRNGGRNWVVQGDNTKWAGYTGNDISAVDRRTAWATLSNDQTDSGIILHTTNGGRTWTKQALPEGVEGGMKSVKGLTRREAWAVSCGGTILHTTDGGKVWSIVNTEIDLSNLNYVNRIDAIGYRELQRPYKINANVWFTMRNDTNWGIAHTLYNGEIWRQEWIPFTVSGSGGHMVSAHSPQVVWAAAWFDGHLYRTVDGGENWEAVGEVGPNDIDDMCAYNADALWFVQFQGGSGGGIIYHAGLENGHFYADDFMPDLDYRYEGLTCVSDQAAVVVGYTDSDDPSIQRGIILATSDGGKSWDRQPVPVDGVRFWKVSFVGAQR